MGGWKVLGILRAMMENQMEKKVATEMESGLG